MFEPVSNIEYLRLAPDRQILVAVDGDVQVVAERWKERAAAAVCFSARGDLTKLTRDLLANPHIRAIVLVGEGAGLDRIRHFWLCQEGLPPGPIADWLIDLIVRWVDLYDEDCDIRLPLPPFWPERIFLDEKECR